MKDRHACWRAAPLCVYQRYFTHKILLCFGGYTRHAMRFAEGVDLPCAAVFRYVCAWVMSHSRLFIHMFWPR